MKPLSGQISRAGWVISGKGYESNQVLAFIRSQGTIAVIRPKSNRRELWK